MNYTVEVIMFVLFVLGASFCFWYFSYLRRYWHVGNGMRLARNRDDGTVWVASRLVDSPSGRAGVKNQSQVFSRNGQKAVFASDEEFRAWSKGNKGKTATWEFEDGLVVELVPEMIKTEIPVYWVPGESFKRRCEWLNRSEIVKKGVKLCLKTDQSVPLYSPTEESIRSILKL